MTGTPTGAYVFTPKLRQQSIVRRQVSLWSKQSIGLRIMVNGELADPDSSSLSAELFVNTDYDSGDPIGDSLGVLTMGTGLFNESVGIYSFVLPEAAVSQPAEIAVVWNYTASGVAQTYTDYIIVLEYMPTYDALSDGEQSVVQQVNWQFGDLYDSVNGGPHLIEEFQTHFGYERIAQIAHLALNKINFTRYPITTFSIGASTSTTSSLSPNSPLATSGTMAGPFPPSWYGVLQEGTYIETLKHLIRSYVEQPQISGATITYTDRRDYVQRWSSVLAAEEEDYKNMLIYFKRALLPLDASALAVAGGIYGGAGWGWRSGTYAAQTRAARFGPVSFVVSYGGAR